jgi:hypothetical protein
VKKVLITVGCLITLVFADKAEIVSQPVRSRWLSLQADTLGRPHIGYCRIDSQIPTYKWRITYSKKDGSWQDQVVDSSSAISHDPAGPPDVSLAMDANDEPGIFYWKAVQGDSISYGHKTGSSWSVDNARAEYPSWPVLRYGGTIPFVVYSHRTSDNWVIIGSPGLSPSGWVWDSTSVPDRLNSGDKVLDFIWDQNNHAQILCIPINSTGHKRLVRWLTWDGSTWSGNQPIDSIGSDPREYGVHMAMSRSGVVGAVYAHQDNGGSGGPYALYYSTRTGSNWAQPEILDTIKMSTAYGAHYCGPALAYDTLSQPHIVYISDGSSNNWVLTHLYKEGGTWQHAVLDTLRDHPYFYRVEIAVDRLNRLHVAYIAGNGSENLYYLAPGGSGIEEVEQQPLDRSLLQVLKSVTRGSFEFRLAGGQTAEVGIYNGAGSLIATARIENGSGQWHARNLPAGLYFVRLRGSSDAAVKVIKVE